MQFDFEKYQLRSLQFYDMLLPEEAKYAKASSTRQEYKRGQTIIREGTFSKGIYLIRKGKVKIHNSNPEGKESILYIYKKGEFFGYRPLVAREPNPISATAIDPVVVTFLPKHIFLELLDSSPVFARRLLESITSEFTVWINKITLFSQHAVKERTAMALLILSQVYKKGRPGTRNLEINIGRDDLAAYIGTAKETVVRMLRVFKDEKIISAHGKKIKILKPQVLIGYSKYF
jgi:CRP-like cAMP-binding protein